MLSGLKGGKFWTVGERKGGGVSYANVSFSFSLQGSNIQMRTEIDDKYGLYWLSATFFREIQPIPL
jgi:hypothetical protein